MCQVQGLPPGSHSRGQSVPENTQAATLPALRQSRDIPLLPPGANTCLVMSAESIPVYSRSCFQFVKSASKIRHCVRARAQPVNVSCHEQLRLAKEIAKLLQVADNTARAQLHSEG